MGQRLTQTVNKTFLGRTRGRRGDDDYVHLLREMKMSFATEEYSPPRRMAFEVRWPKHMATDDAAH